MRSQYIHLKKGDTASDVYRIVSCKRFLQMLKDGNNGLVRPRMWDDPFENFILNGIAVAADGTKARIGFRNQLYGQCWSQHKEVDLMWRAYSPGNAAVKLRSNVGALLRTLYSCAGKYREISCFIGRVQYTSRYKLSRVLNLVNLIDPSGRNIARTLLVKRWAFRAEKEVRLIYFNQDSDFDNDVFSYAVDTNALVTEAVLDPRMLPNEVDIWKKRFRKAGFTNRMIQSGLYKPPEGIFVPIK
ncbi:MAG: hypothetical protein QGH42_04420 [Kiritimatiellia bacterium]|jgi:hypothetical protein|nr:hypothetical protein [Kiritimatiellia bacterium]MDP6809670.1 hypothetical protein [Kiritimatiellia bacterium]MDP7023480.1 hypothetical protein [Kiritimatiellia bacterium]